MSRYDPSKHHRRSIRLRGWDYRDAGAYFVTIVTYDRAHLFGEFVDGTMVISTFGHIVAEEWERTAQLRPYVRLDAFVVMPNHMHGVVWIVDGATTVVGAQRRCAPTPTNVLPRSLGAIVRAFKSATTKRVNQIRGAPGAPVWQRNYYERVVRDERGLNAIRKYIRNNPVNWRSDIENP